MSSVERSIKLVSLLIAAAGLSQAQKEGFPPTPAPSATASPTTPTFVPTPMPTSFVLGYDDLTIDILGQSGKMTLTTASGKSSKVTFDFIEELTADGSLSGNKGPNSGKHSLQTFASTDFTFSTPTKETIYGLDAKSISFSTPLVDDTATLTVTTYVFLEGGTISPTGSESFQVSAGTVKFNVELENWPFCTSTDSSTPCESSVGAFVDVGISIQGASEPLTPSKLDAELLLSKEVYLDGSWQSMESGYPEATSSGSDTMTYTFRFPKFSEKALYDPLITFYAEEESSDDDNAEDQLLGLGLVVGIGALCVCACACAAALLLRRRQSENKYGAMETEKTKAADSTDVTTV